MNATDMIRGDHMKVIATFHRYDINAKPRTKQALAKGICLALEVHAQLEEEIFYPAVRSVDPEVVAKSIPEHDEMRALMATLRAMDPANDIYDAAVMELMRTVIHHVADEETVLLPEAEAVLGDRVHDLGARMMKRRLQLMLPRARPGKGILVGAGALLAGAYVFAVMSRPPGRKAALWR